MNDRRMRSWGSSSAPKWFRLEDGWMGWADAMAGQVLVLGEDATSVPGASVPAGIDT